MEFLERFAVGGDRFFEARRADLALAERSQRSAEIVLGRGPLQRHALAGAFLERLAVGGDRLFEGAVPLSRSPSRSRALPRLFWVMAQSSGTRSRVRTSSASR